MKHYIVLTIDGQIIDIGSKKDFCEAEEYVYENLELESVWITTLGDWKDMFKDCGYKLTKVNDDYKPYTNIDNIVNDMLATGGKK